MRIGVGSVESNKLNLFGFSSDGEVQLTIELTLDEVLSLRDVLNQAPGIMAGLKAGEEAAQIGPSRGAPSR